MREVQDHTALEISETAVVEKYDGDPAPGALPVEIVIIHGGELVDVWHPLSATEPILVKTRELAQDGTLREHVVLHPPMADPTLAPVITDA